ncbi:hypothetical protein D2A34_14250 [Clostridium chromiireducens]|uniref:Uncharacterized protein n=1 Tax=Clostridium chromiireducens TaxID=225345 RepID=A0A399IU06_9CLOT|nr:hypothetical protein [Clostridium chromiireducens]RII34306.1 hypothetical protein D2A34_14250 [Clostridium chromiireducens]
MKYLELFFKILLGLLKLLIVLSFIAITFGISYGLGWIVGSLSGINITLCRVISFILITISVLSTMNNPQVYHNNFGKFFILGYLLRNNSHKKE